MKKIALLFLIFTLLLLTGCINQREVTEPDYTINDLLRPSVTEHTPFSNAVDVVLQKDVTVYFSELMTHSSIENNFELYRVVDADSILTVVIDDANGVMYSGKKNQGMFERNLTDDSWYWISESNPNITVNKLSISNSNPNVIYGLTNIGVIKTVDAGDSWSVIDERIFTALTIDKADENSVYLASATEGVLFSNDGGVSWTAKNSGLRVGRPLSEISIESSGNQILFLTSIGDYIYRTEDGADTWVRIRTGLSSRDFSNVSIAPTNSSVVYSSATNGILYKSKDLGNTWSNITSNLTPSVVNDIVVSPISDSTIHIATESGVYSSNNGGTSWTEPAIFTSGGSISEPGIIFDLEIKKSDQNYILCGTENGIYISEDGGEIFDKKSSVSHDNLTVQGEFQYESWQGETVVIDYIDSVAVDTSIISPYINERGLRLWVANGSVGEPPIEANPKATMMTYKISKSLAPNWLYRVSVKGTFESDKTTPLSNRGVEDVSGNSLETSRSYTFTTGTK